MTRILVHLVPLVPLATAVLTGTGDFSCHFTKPTADCLFFSVSLEMQANPAPKAHLVCSVELTPMLDLCLAEPAHLDPRDNRARRVPQDLQ